MKNGRKKGRKTQLVPAGGGEVVHGGLDTRTCLLFLNERRDFLLHGSC